MPPLRFRSWPHPHRIRAGDEVGVPVGQPGDELDGDVGLRGCPFERPRQRFLAQQLGVVRVLVEERAIGEPAFEEVAMDRERDRQIGAGAKGQMQIGMLGQRGRSRVDDDEPGSAPLRFAQIGDHVDAGGRRVDAPDDDQARFGVVLVGHRRHLSVERAVGSSRRGRAYGACEPRCAQASKERRVARILREQAVRSAVGIREDRFGSPSFRAPRACESRRAPALRPMRCARSAHLRPWVPS